MPLTNNIITTDDDVFILEDEAHLQSHHITSNLKQNSVARDNKINQKATGKIYNTHDGRQKQPSD